MMGNTTTAYLSLGSNIGQRPITLQKAILQLDQKAGKVLQISAVYENAAFDFDGASFLNICISLTTVLEPNVLLKKIEEIEKDLGRKTKSTAGYQSRPIDIDILYYDHLVLQTPALTIPHPRMTTRSFVLKPLTDIAPQFYHPVLHKDSRNLLQESKSEHPLQRTKLHFIPNRKALFSHFQFFCIEGNIGSGKTTLAQKIAADYNAKLILERFADNPFLPKFYEDSTRYAFPLEMSFLADRYRQFMEGTSQFDLFKDFVIGDYGISKSLIFAQITLMPDEFQLYRRLFEIMCRELKKPDVYLFLHQTPERLLTNIRKRGRSYEQNISVTYLNQIQQGYLDYIKRNPDMNSLIIDLEDLDFEANITDYETVLSHIENHLIFNFLRKF